MAQRTLRKINKKISKRKLNYSRASIIVKNKNKKFTRKDARNRVIISFIVWSIISLSLTSAFILSYIQSVSATLPDPNEPFKEKVIASEIYDKDGNLLYRITSDEDRDPVELENIPGHVIWAFLAAEDIDFYKHKGIDYKGIGRCTVQAILSNEVTCGASTITQQLVRKTVLTDDVKIDRKIREIVLAMKVEETYTKDEILEMYLTVVPLGSNIYGITRASQFYFDKDVKELSLAEAVILASIPQNPSVLSPTKSINPESSHQLLRDRRSYVVGQLEKHLELVNQDLKLRNENLISPRRLNRAEKRNVEYARPDFSIKSPHFVFFALNQLQSKEYVGEQPLTIEEIESKGLKIYTTLDSGMQKVAEQQVKKGVDIYGKAYGGSNAGLVSLDPKTGKVLAMVGSYDYFGDLHPKGCLQGQNCEFEPQVNITNTLQAYGSTLKPMIYYEAVMHGLITPETVMDDSKIFIGNYIPKNYDGKFRGKRTARYMLSTSRNIPAIALLDTMKTPNFINTMKNWGYTTFTGPYYGPAVAVGGADVTLIEHAQAYTVFANNGNKANYEVIERIEDSKGNILYEHQSVVRKVADERGIYVVNHMLNANNGGPGYGFDGRDIAGKTGTSEDQKETLYVGYTPELVTVGILGNNNNKPMIYGASGFSSARPWVGEYIKQVLVNSPKTQFIRPEGVYVTKSGDLVIDGVSRANKTFSFASYR